MNHRSRPDLPPQWRPSPRLRPLQAKSQTAALPVILDPRASLSSPPESPSPTSPFPTFAGQRQPRDHLPRPPSNELQEIEDEEYATRPYNPYNLPPASVIAVEAGSQSLSHSRVSERGGLDNPVIPEDEEHDVTESQATTISTFFSPDLDARLPRTPDSDDNVGRRGRPVVQKRIASRGGGGVVRSTTRTTRVSPMATPTEARFSRDVRDRGSHETSFACVGAKAVTNNSKRGRLASLLGIRDKKANKGAPKTVPRNDENAMDLDVDGALDLDLKRFKSSAWGDAVSDVGSWDEHLFAAGGGREDRGSGEGDGHGQWTEYLQTVGDAMTIASMDFTTPRAAPPPPNPSLPTIPTVPSLSPLDPTQQSDSVVTSTPRTKERAKKRAKRTGRILSVGFPSPSMDFHTLPTTTFGLGLEGIELELAMAMDTDFMDIDNHRDGDAVDGDGDVHMDQLTDATPTMTMKTTITSGTTKDRGQNLQPMATDVQRHQQPTPADSIIRLPPTSLNLKTPFNGSSRPAHPTASGNNSLGTATMTKPLPLPQNRQPLLTRTLGPRTPLSGSKPPVQKLMGKAMLSLPSVSTPIVTPRPTRWNESSPATPTQQLLSPLSPSPTPSPQQTPCPPERLPRAKKPPQPVRPAGRSAPVPKVVGKGEERVVGKAVPVTSANGKRAGTMDEVRMCAQIDQCIIATDGMEEVSHILAVIVVSILTIPIADSALLQLFRLDTIHNHLRPVKGRVGGDDGHYRGRGGEQFRWGRICFECDCDARHPAVEAEAPVVGVVHSEVNFLLPSCFVKSVINILPNRNVLKYYQLAEHTCSKPPRISRMEERMDKLVAYLRKFRDLNIRILVRLFLPLLALVT